MMRLNDNTCVAMVHVQISPTFFGWLAQFGNRMRVLSPDQVVDRYKKHISQVDHARKLDVSNMKMNSIFKQLDEDALVHLMEGKRGKYILADMAKTIIKEIDSLENKLEGADR